MEIIDQAINTVKDVDCKVENTIAGIYGTIGLENDMLTTATKVLLYVGIAYGAYKLVTGN